jgi:integrase
MVGKMVGSKADIGTSQRLKPRGPHPHQRLSPVRIRSLTTPGKYADGNGLYLVVEPSSRSENGKVTLVKRWMLRTVVTGKRRELGLGSARLVSLAEAREEAAALRKQARKGVDIKAARKQAKREVPAFTEAAKQVHIEHAKSFKNSKHKKQWLSSLEDSVFPIFGDRRVDQVDTDDVLRALTPIWIKKPETARRVRQRIRIVLDWCKAKGFRTGDNPVEELSKVLPRQPKKEAHHAALAYGLVPAFIKELRESDTIGMTVKLAVELTILCATRTNETLQARWGEIDLDERVWTIPAERMKAGRAHAIPLSARTLEILTDARRLGPHERSDYVFSGRRVDQPLSNMAMLMALRRLKRDDITVHGFRSSFRDWASERTSVSREVCEAALAHVVKDKAEAAYARSTLFEKRRKLMQTWSTFATTKSGVVVPMRA